MKCSRRVAAIHLTHALIASGAVIGFPTTVAAAYLPGWATEVSERPIPSAFLDADAVVLDESAEIVVKGGARTIERRRVIRVLTEKGTEEAELWTERDSFRKVDAIRVWVGLPDGRVRRYDEDDGSIFSIADPKILDDQETIRIRPPALPIGSTVAYAWRESISEELPQDFLSIERGAPVLHARVTVDARKGWAVRARSTKGPTGGPSESVDTGTWEFRDVPATDVDDQPWAPVPARLRLALDYVPPNKRLPFDSWESTAAWVGRLFAASDIADGVVDETVAPFRDATADPVDAVGRFCRSLRYFGVEVGWGAWQPRPPATTLARLLGDCKDKALLMVVLLRRLGVDAFPVLLMERTDGFVAADVPSPFQFNHCVVAIPWKDRPVEFGMTVVDAPGLGRVRIFDATLPPALPLDASVTSGGAVGLVIAPGSAGLITLGKSGADENVSDSRVTWRVDADGNLDVVEDVTYRGVLRAFLVGPSGEPLDPEKTRRVFFRSAAPSCPEMGGFAVERIESPNQDGWTYRVRYRCPAFLERVGPFEPLWLPEWGMTQAFAPPAEDAKAPKYQPLLATFRESYSITLDGRQTRRIPESIQVANELGRVLLKATKAPDGAVLVEREVAILAPEIPVSKREDAAALRRALGAIGKAAVVVEGAR